MMVRAIAVGVSGACLAVIVAAEGSPGWQVVRGMFVVGLTAGAVHATRTRDGAPRGAVLFGVGVIAVAVGAGIAIPHLAKSDITLRTVAAVGALATGLLALVLGAMDLAGTVRGWRRVPVVAGLVFVVLIGLRTVGPAVAATNVPTIELGTETPGDRGVEYVDVELRTQHGIVLGAWYVPSRNGAAVVVLHGAGSTRSSVLDQALVLADHGFGVLLYDARGHGESEGQAMDFGWMGNEDIGAALAFLERQPDVDDERIGVLGLSMGGEQALGAAAGDPRIMAVVAEGATGRVAGDYSWLSDAYGLAGWFQEQLDRVMFATTNLLTEATPPIMLHDAVDESQRPTLLIAAGDVPDEEEAAAYIESGSPDNVDVWVVPDADHTDGLDTQPAEWEQRVVAFFEQGLAPTTP